jgi:hypothetical protein
MWLRGRIAAGWHACIQGVVCGLLAAAMSISMPSAAMSEAVADGATGKYFSSELRGLKPAVDGLGVEVLDGDDAIRFRNVTGRSFVIPGYDDEPYLRFRANGVVEENVRSPTKYVNVDRYALAPIPSVADSDAPPRWKPVSRNGEYDWHDHRIHWMSRETPPQVKDRGRRTKVMDWAIPIAFVDGDRARAVGTLFWDTSSHGSAADEEGEGGVVGIPLATVISAAALAAVVVAALAMRRRTRSRSAAR